jgi:DNA-binding NarL/FixJ family response regulator
MPNSVLIVDDSSIVRKVMRDFFESLTDWIIKGEAGNGAEAIQRAKEIIPDLILLDFSMPNMNGIETASALKNMLPGAYIIVFTMYADALGSRLSSAVGVDLVVSKAEGLNGLVKAVNQLLGIAEPNKCDRIIDRQTANAKEHR